MKPKFPQFETETVRKFLGLKNAHVNIRSIDCRLLVICTSGRWKCLFYKVSCLVTETATKCNELSC